MTNLDELQEKLGYKYNNPVLLKRALTHSSYAYEKHVEYGSNERLEFLGDSVLGFITADYFYHHCSLPEGDLTKKRAATVCERSLHQFSKELELNKYLLLGKGEINTGGADRPSILADAFEAVLASIYLDGGIEPAREFVLRFVKESVNSKPNFKDYKTTLQEVIQKNPDGKLNYVLTDESGPDHDKSFTVDVQLNGSVIGRGTGRSKKAAAQEAAREALEHMGL